MSMDTSKALRTCSIVLVCAAALSAAACGSVEPSPTAPSPVTAPSPTPGPAPQPAPTPTGPGKIEVTVNPNPAPWSGTPIEGSGCSGVPNTWFYEQTIRNTGGESVTVSDRTDFFNGREVSKRSSLGIVIAPGGSHKLTTRWCSASAGPHTAKTDFSGQDAKGTFVVFHGSTVTLNAK